MQTKIFKRSSFLPVLSLAMVFTALLTGCKKEEPTYPLPVLSIDGNAEAELKPGATVSVVLTVNGGGGAKAIRVKRGGGFLEEVPVDENAVSFTYNTQKVPDDLGEGEELSYGFSLVNKNNVESPEVSFLVTGALYDKITVGSEALFDVAIPTDGIVNSGSAVKLVKGRKYHISKSLTFAPGAKLEVEEGVTVYVKADRENPIEIEIQGEAAILGTASAPVVFTSSRALTPNTPAAPGDWTWFRLSGSGNTSNSGKINYLRLEYAGERAFRLTEVGEATEIDYVQVYKASGEGVMITNGNARLKHIVATDCEGGSFRLGNQYSGYMQFLISVNSAYYAENDDFSIREEASPVISNLTVLGAGQDISNTHGMRIRATAAPKIYNAIIAEFPRRGVRGTDDISITDMSGAAVFAHSYVFAVNTDPYRDLAVAFAGTFDAVTGERLTNPFNNNVTKRLGSTFEVASIPGIGVGDFVPDAETPGEFNPSSVHAFFSAAAYAGAVNGSNGDWTKGWVKNPDGSIR